MSFTRTWAVLGFLLILFLSACSGQHTAAPGQETPPEPVPLLPELQEPEAEFFEAEVNLDTAPEAAPQDPEAAPSTKKPAPKETAATQDSDRARTARETAARLRAKLEAHRKALQQVSPQRPKKKLRRPPSSLPEWTLPVSQQREQPDTSGRWSVARPANPEALMSDEDRESIEELEAIGYVSGSMPASIASGVILYDKQRAWPGLNFYTSGHGQEARLIDMEGKDRHVWKSSYKEAFPDVPHQHWENGSEFWRRAFLYPNGDILAIYEGVGLAKFDKDSRRLWSQPNRAHHDLEIMPNGDLYVLTRQAQYLKRLGHHRPILVDSISILDAEGKLKRSVSILECFENAEKLRHYWTDYKHKWGDCFHTNTLSVLDGDIKYKVPEFKQGRVLVSILRMSLIGVIDLDREEFVWIHQGSFRAQHDPQILANGNILLFDNKGLPTQSRVLEIDPVTQKVVWSYQGSKEHPFYSRTCSTAQRLPNGNTLITESDPGRAFEVTPEGDIVWDFYNPNRAGQQQEFIATLFEVYRLPNDFPLQWLPAKAPPAS